MKRKIALMLAAVMALSAAGCGDTSADDRKNDEKKASVVNTEEILNESSAEKASGFEIEIVDSGLKLDHTPTAEEFAPIAAKAIEQFDASVEQDPEKYISSYSLGSILDDDGMKEFYEKYSVTFEDTEYCVKNDVYTFAADFIDEYLYENYSDAERFPSEYDSFDSYYGFVRKAAEGIGGDWLKISDIRESLAYDMVISQARENELTPEVYGGAKVYAILSGCQKDGDSLYTQFSLTWAENGTGYVAEGSGWYIGGEAGVMLTDVELQKAEMTEEEMDDASKKYAENTALNNANKAAKIGYNAVAEFFADKETMGEDPESLISSGYFTEANGEGISLAEEMEYTAEGDSMLYKVFKEESGIDHGTVYVGVSEQSMSAYEDTSIWSRIFVQYKDENGVTGQYPNPLTADTESLAEWRSCYIPEREDIDPTAGMNRSEVLLAANLYAKTAFNASAEYFADQETKGRKIPQVMADGDFVKCASPEGFDLLDTASADGDACIAASLEDCGVAGGTVILVVFSDDYMEDHPNSCEWFIQWRGKDGTVGQYPDPISADRQAYVCFGQFLPR